MAKILGSEWWLIFPKRLCLFGFSNCVCEPGGGLTEGWIVRAPPLPRSQGDTNRTRASGTISEPGPLPSPDPPQNGPIGRGPRSSWSPTYCSILAAPSRPNPHESVAQESSPTLSCRGVETPFPGHPDRNTRGGQIASQCTPWAARSPPGRRTGQP